MIARRITAATPDLLDPGHPAWAAADRELLKMETPPIGNAPSDYFRAMDPLKIGAVKEISAAALHNGEAIFFRMEWAEPSPSAGIHDLDQYRDGVGVLMPFLDDAKFQSMGSLKQPVNAWCWQAGLDQPFNVTAAGLGTTKREKNSYHRVNPVHQNGRWQVVISRPFVVPEPELNVALAPGLTKKVGFAVWSGKNRERAGAKSYCGNWRQVVIEP